MGLGGQAGARGETGYAMAALLIALAIMAILMTVAMPVWRHEARREREAELVFRGEQYARAIALYRFKNAQIPNALPPSIEALVDGRYLRKKYKDPMTKDGEFVIMPMATQLQPGMPTQPGPMPPPGAGRGPSPSTMTPPSGGSPLGIGGIMGVRSKSQETSVRSYRGATRYDQWNFTFNIAPRPGGSIPMANTPDGRGTNPAAPGTFPGRGQGNRGPGRGPGIGTGDGRGRSFGPGGPPPPPPPPPPGGARGAGPGRGRGF